MKSGGTTRRAAKMVCLDMDHPEILDFIEWKVKEERKAKVLIEAGYSSDMDGEAYSTVSGQNANNSVRITDKFMKAVEADKEWHTTERTTGKRAETYKAKHLMNKICDAAWECADPGVQFDDAYNKWNTLKNAGRINSTNPCSEFASIDDTACNLSSLNMVKFINEESGLFNINAFEHVIRIMFLAQEILVSMASYPTEKIAYNAYRFRQLGLGYTNLGAFLMRKGLAYDSDEARNLNASVTSLMTAISYKTSIQIAQEIGPFEGYEENKESMLDVIENHANMSTKISGNFEFSYISEEANDVWVWNVKNSKKSGLRNAQGTVLPPAGTVSFVMGCDTTGIEPDFSLVKNKKLAGGGTMDIVNQSVAPSLECLGYSDIESQNIIKYIEDNKTVEGCESIKNEHLPVFDCASKPEKGSRFLSVNAHLKMMAAVQPFLSGSISKTVNVPSETTAKDIQDIYFSAWKLGLKSVAIYRDNCKSTQPLNSAGDPIWTPKRRKLPSRRPGFTDEVKIGGHKLYIRTGEYNDGRLGEIFLDMHKEGALAKALLSAFAISVSQGLQHGIPLKKYIKTFQYTTFEPKGLVNHPIIKTCSSILDFIFADLKEHYHPDDVIEEEKIEFKVENTKGDAPICPDCGHIMIRQGGCPKCNNCGSQHGVCGG